MHCITEVLSTTGLFTSLEHYTEHWLYKSTADGKTLNTGSSLPLSLLLRTSFHTLIVLNTLNPLWAVLIMTPGSWGCQCNSLMSVCPWCINNSWGGTLGSSSPSAVLASVLSFSTARSQIEIWSSDPEAANTELSLGFHSIDVIGAVWCLKEATGFPFCW